MASSLKVYNTLSRKKEAFSPLVIPKTATSAGKSASEVWMYVCGVTPYDYSHVGHGRAYASFDVIKRYLEFPKAAGGPGFSVKYVQNVTDVEDKILKRAAELNEDPLALAARFTREYFTDIHRLGVRDADVYPLVSTHIPHVIALIERLVDKGFAYANNSGVYFSVVKFKTYGKLSHQSVDQLKAGARVDVDEEKQAPEDFALWKAAKHGESLSWDSPWGKGRPGWHIECSAMAFAHLGEQIDIHGGGNDLMFPHHENEIAQSEGASGKVPFAKYWLHNGFVMVGKDKMSKSLGNFLTLRQALDKLGPELLRYMYVSVHYRQPTDFSDDRISAARGSLNKFKDVLAFAESALAQKNGKTNATSVASLVEKPSLQIVKAVDAFRAQFVDAMDDDFNTPSALSVLAAFRERLNEWARDSTVTHAELTFGLAGFRELSTVLGLFEAGAGRHLPEGLTEETIGALLSAREAAKKAKDYKRADAIRSELKAKGILIEDSPGGAKWSLAA